MQSFFQFLMLHVFGKKWILYDLKQGYKSAIFLNEVELAIHEEKCKNVRKQKVELEVALEQAQTREPLTNAEYLAMLPSNVAGELLGLSDLELEQKKPKALYDIKKKVDGERAEEIATLRNRVAQMDDEIQSADNELQKGYASAYKNRNYYDFLKEYKIKKSYTDK